MSATSFFGSRWVTAPAGIAGAASLPAGFREAGVAAGLKRRDALDLGLIVSDVPGTVSAARFCDSGVLAAPVVLTRERCNLAALRAVVVNSGNANAATGEAGIEEAQRVQEAAAAALGLEPREVAVASTGVIGVLLDGARVAAHVPSLIDGLAPDATNFATRSRRPTPSTSGLTCAWRCPRAMSTSRRSARAPG